MTWSLDAVRIVSRRGAGALVAMALLGAAAARADLPGWMQTAVAGSAVEAALYRAMALPGARVLYPRPPAEARAQLDALVTATPDAAELYALRARTEEQALDEAAAEQDWKNAVLHARDKSAAGLALADFYHRRVRGPEEVAALEEAASAPQAAAERYLPADQQTAWAAYGLALTVVHDQALGDEAALAVGRAWVVRYPLEPAARAAYVLQTITLKRFDLTAQAIADYRKAFPADETFPVKATAYAALSEGGSDAATRAVALFDASYQPLWPDDLVDSYFELLTAAHREHAFLAHAQAQLAANPADWMAETRLFLAYKHQGRLSAATASLAAYRAAKERSHAAWSADELYTFASLLKRAQQPELAAKNYFALAGTAGTLTESKETPDEAGLAGIIHLLFEAPESPVALGSGNLTIFRDAATIDQGPGYWNGILSLWLNSARPAEEYATEEQLATPYFHRAKAAELLTVFDKRYPHGTERPALHLALLAAYRDYGRYDAVEVEAKSFLAEFPDAPQRLEVAFDLAEAQGLLHEDAGLVALYDSLLAEYGRKLKGRPLPPAPHATETTANDDQAPPASDAEAADADTSDEVPKPKAVARDELRESFRMAALPPQGAADAVAYQEILDRYLGLLTSTNQLPAALAVLRRELDRNPDDPAMYERLAQFLEQNDLGAQQEAVYQQAAAHFKDTGWYDKLARFYLRTKRRQDYDATSRKVVDLFAGTELEDYFKRVQGPWADEAVALNLYAHQRFPHDLTFTRNLLRSYHAKPTLNDAAWHALLREHWQDAPDLEQEYLADLARTGKLDTERSTLNAVLAAAPASDDPAAMRELAAIDVWQSHFEQSAPLLGRLAEAYPADAVVGQRTESVYRSLAYHEATYVDRAAAVAARLVEAEPGDLDRLATVGDIFANSTSPELNLDNAVQLNRAAPYWLRMAQVHPGLARGYVDSATVFWDYFDFPAALEQVELGQKNLKNSSLFAFEAGVIAEDSGKDAQAVSEYVQAAVGSGTSAPDASDRLTTLAARPQMAALVDQATAAEVKRHPAAAALELRAAVLRVQGRPGELDALLEDAIAGTASRDDLAELAAFSATHGQTRAYLAALARTVQLTDDPVEKIEAQYKLVAALSDAGQIPQAQAIVAAVYKADPKLVGVVRTTTDFYWAHQQPKPAIATLMDAAKNANAEYALDFRLEAVAKSNESGDYAGARGLLAPLLEGDPFNARYLALAAESYAVAHDPAGLRGFYAAKLAAMEAVQPDAGALSAADRRARVALLREGMIGALTDLKDVAGATDQHIALLRAYPADQSLVDNAASYARLHGTEAQLKSFLTQAVAASPNDARYAIDLARVDVAFEDPDGALAAYSRAIQIRRGEADLYIARADLEERRQAFDAACADYEALYGLTYKDPQWMEKTALARARQGRGEDAAKALSAARIEGRAATPDAAFRVAATLSDWGFQTEAQRLVETGLKLAGDDLLRDPNDSGDAEIAARILARERRAGDALALLDRLHGLGGGSASAPAIVVRQVQEKGLGAVTDAQWRAQLVERRRQQAERSYHAAVQALSAVAGERYTPEEKAAFAVLLDHERAQRPAAEVVDLWIPAANAAGLVDREATWRHDVLLGAGSELAAQQLNPYNELETARMDARVRAQTLEAYAARQKRDAQNEPLALAASAWQDAGDRVAELRDLRTLVFARGQQQYERQLLEALGGDTPGELSRLAATGGPEASEAAAMLGERGSQAEIYSLLTARAPLETPLWVNAYRALYGLYFGDVSTGTGSAFQQVLGTQTLGEALTAGPQPERSFAGEPWFPYAMRYGVWASLRPENASLMEDYLPAGLEAAPHAASSYDALGEAYADAGKPDAAIAEYRHAEELAPEQAAANLAIARLLWYQGKTDAAVAEWTLALGKLQAAVDTPHALPESFYTEFAGVAEDAAKYHVGARLKPAMGAVIFTFIAKNGTYRSEELEHSAYTALSGEGQAAAAAWVISLADGAGDDQRRGVLDGLATTGWYPYAQLDQLYRRLIALVSAQVRQPLAAAAQTEGDADSSEDASVSTNSSTELADLKRRYIEWLLAHDRVDEAAKTLAGASDAERATPSLIEAALLLAARQGRLAAVLAGYESDAAHAPDVTMLAALANALRLSGDHPDQRLLLEYVFRSKFRQQELAASDYLALAEARLQTNDMAGALDLLRRMTNTGDYYENLDSAAALLERSGHPAEALPLLTRLAGATPWSAAYRLRLAKAKQSMHQDASALLAGVAADQDAAYRDRVEAARGLAGAQAGNALGSQELTLLAGGHVSPEAASQPYFVAARSVASAQAQSRPVQLQLLRAALLVAAAESRAGLDYALFEAEIAAGDDRQARVADTALERRVTGLRQGPPIAGEASFCAANGEESPVRDDEGHGLLRGDFYETALAENAYTYTPPVVDPPDELKPALARARFLRELGELEERAHALSEAAGDFACAARWTEDPGRRKALEAQAAALRVRVHVAEQNAVRRPSLLITQTSAARARLASAQAAAARAAGGMNVEEMERRAAAPKDALNPAQVNTARVRPRILAGVAQEVRP